MPGLARSSRRSLNFLWQCLAAIALFVGFTGCTLPEKPKTLSRTQEIEVVDPDRLRVDILSYLEGTQARFIGAMSKIAAGTDNRAVREATIRMKISVVDIAAAIVREPDARTAFVYTWAFAAGGRYNVTEGAMKSAFGDQQQIVVDVAREAEHEVIEIGRQHFDDETIEAAKDEIEDVARRVTAVNLLANHDVMAKVRIGLGADVAGLMLAPLTSLQGVASTPAAVNNIARVVDSLSNQIDFMPQRVRWETELLLLEIESMRTVVQASADVNQFTDSFEIVAREIDHLPEELRSQTEEMLKELEQLQPEFQATLAQGQKTAAEVRQVTENVHQATEAFQTLAPQVQEITVSFKDVLPELQAVIGEIRQMKGPHDPNKPPMDTMAMLEQSNVLVGQTHAVVTELRQLLSELKAPLGPTSSIVETKGHTRELIDMATRRAILLIAVVACAAMVVIVFRRLVLGRSVPAGQK